MKHKQIVNPLVASLVLFRVGSYREVLKMDLEDAIKTYSIFYIDYKNQEAEYEHSKRI